MSGAWHIVGVGGPVLHSGVSVLELQAAVRIAHCNQWFEWFESLLIQRFAVAVGVFVRWLMTQVSEKYPYRSG